MSNCAQHHDYKGAIGYCPRCRIAELKAENAKLREAAQALYDSKFKDPKTGNQCVAFCELEKMAALLQERGE